MLHRLLPREGHRRIVANTAWLFVDKFAYACIGILVGAWVARYLGPALFGQYNFALAIVGLLAPVSGLGLQSIAVRNLIRAPADKEVILGTILVLKLGASLLLVVTLVTSLACGFGPWSEVLRWLIIIISWQLIFDPVGETVISWFESKLQSKYIVLARNTAMVLGSAVKVGLILACAPLLAFGFASVLQALASACFLIALYRTTGNKLSMLRANFSYAKELLADSWPLMLSGVAIVIHMRIDQIMLGYMIGSESLGIYSAAVRLSELTYFLPVAAAISLFPAIVRTREHQSSSVYEQRIQAFFDMMTGMAYTVALPVTFIALPLVTTLFGQEYTAAGPILRVHIWALVFVSLGVARGQWLVAENLTGFALLTNVLGGVVNIGLNLLMIPKYGGLGAAWATLISQATADFLSGFLHPRTRLVFIQGATALLVPIRLPMVLKSLRKIIVG